MSEALRSQGAQRSGLARLVPAAAARAMTVAALGAALVAVEIVLRGRPDVRWQVAGQLGAFALFLPAALLSWRGLAIGRFGLVLVLVVALVLRVAAFEPTAAPPLSTDLNRYVWDGRVQAAGINPYRHAPTDPRLARLRDGVVWPAINHRTWRTNYPPGAELSFAAARGVFGHGLRATTWLFLLAEGVAVGALVLVLLRLRAPPERVLVAAWHPLAVSEIAANGHVDALALLGGALLLLALAYRRNALAGAAIGFGALVKLGPLLLALALSRRGGRRLVAMAVCLFGLGYLAYASAGARVIGTTPRLLAREDIGSLAWFSLTKAMSGDAARLLLATLLVAVVAVVSLRAHDTLDQVARTCLVVLGGELLATNYLQPWYALWLLPFLVVTVAPAWLWLTGTLPLIYVFAIEHGLPWWVRAGIYGPFLTLSLVRLARPRRASQAALAPLGAARIAAVIPVLDEAESLPGVLAEFPAGVVDEVVVVDGGSTDATVELARAAGARLLVETGRGYGRACLAGVKATDSDVIVFLDGDGSDDPAAIARLVEPVLSGRAALVLGARARPESGAQRTHQRLGNRFVAALIHLCHGVRVHDIPPMRAVRRDTLESLEMAELSYGWPTEMLVKAARAGLPILELPVPSRARRGGRSKVSGRLGPSLRAGARMLAVVARYA